MKIYTKQGDQGQTSLFSGEKVLKCDDRVHLYGLLDEINCYLGLMLSEKLPKNSIVSEGNIHEIQSTLFTMGSWLATKQDKRSKLNLPKLDNDIVTRLESKIDEMEEVLPPLKNFILPGGGRVASFAHICRALIRSFERGLVLYLSQTKDDDLDGLIVYINRLSDFFFVYSRYMNHLEGIKEKVWKPST